MLFRQEVVDQAANKLEGEVLLLPKLSHRVIAWSLFVWVLLVVLLLFNGQYSRKETVAGWLRPSTGVVRVFNPSPESVISKIYISEGQSVRKGQNLLVLTNSKNLTSGQEFTSGVVEQLDQSKTTLKSQLERLKIKFEEDKHSLEQQIELANKELSFLSKRLDTIRQHEAVTSDEVEKYKRLVEKELISSVQLNKHNKELLSIRSNKQSVERSMSQQESVLSRLTSRLNLLPNKHENDIGSINNEILKIDQQLLQVKSQHEVVVTSPISGDISSLQVNVGQRVSGAIPFFNIVPKESTLMANLLVPVRAAGFIQEGQSIDVRYAAFPYQKFGTYEATIKSIPEAVLLPNEIANLPIEIKEAVYLVEAELKAEKITAYGRDIKLKTGMTLTADVLLSKRTLIEWLLEPLYSLTGSMK